MAVSAARGGAAAFWRAAQPEAVGWTMGDEAKGVQLRRFFADLLL